MIRRTLFLKVYLTLIASLALVAASSALFVHFNSGEAETSWRERRERVVAALLPADADPAAFQATVGRLAEALDADLSVYSADRRLLASAGAPFPADVLSRRGRRDGPDGRIFVFRLSDGRTVAARMDRPFGPGGGGRNPLAWLAMIAAVIGLAAYPVVRHLTRRLERLRRGVDAWGGGALATRVADDGHDEVAAVARSFNKAADHIERLLAAHRSLLANASHELRSPLARLRMAIDLFEQSGSAASRDEILRNLGELDTLVEEILLASRLDHVEKLDLVEPVDLLAVAAEEGARAAVEVTGAPAMVSGDPRLIARLVRNLVQNAQRHGAPPVSIDVAQEGNVARLAVRDHGQGVPEAERDRVFEPFYRPSGRSETAGGWGLGLSLVRQIARHHGASLRYETPADGGACFVVEFPTAQ
ncbi:sensor histidine kinase [Mesorhizobium sp. L-8-10]|uniref:sensor histidine kinase n=1 Tax=Mesorhizobium sp. L-8-10 TaxID=2744523 RepID=UPI001936EE15|nr:ATP-binding protein [Mesorhizobium sp. L-8-10]BCH35452.1 sensor histidine kinase [Mesorhizobium sp. L-8-10]